MPISIKMLIAWGGNFKHDKESISSNKLTILKSWMNRTKDGIWPAYIDMLNSFTPAKVWRTLYIHIFICIYLYNNNIMFSFHWNKIFATLLNIAIWVKNINFVLLLSARQVFRALLVIFYNYSIQNITLFIAIAKIAAKAIPFETVAITKITTKLIGCLNIDLVKQADALITRFFLFIIIKFF